VADDIVALRGFVNEAEASLAASVLQANGVRAEVRTRFGHGYDYRWAVLVNADDTTLARALLDTPAAPPLLHGEPHANLPHARSLRTHALTRLATNVVLWVAVVLFLDVLSGLLGLTPQVASAQALSIVGVLLLVVWNALRQWAIAPQN
jgi:hypothetical protein